MAEKKKLPKDAEEVVPGFVPPHEPIPPPESPLEEPRPDSPAPAAKDARKARPGNKNASKANLHSGDPGLAKKGRRQAAKLFRTWIRELPEHVARDRQVLTALKEMSELTVLRDRALDFCYRHNPVDRVSGELRPVFQQLVELSDRIHRWRLEVLEASNGAEPDREHEHRVTYVGVDEASEPQAGPPWTDPATLAAAFAASRISGPVSGVEVDRSESVEEIGKKKPEKKPPPEALSPPSSELPTREETAAEKYGWVHCFGGDDNL